MCRSTYFVDFLPLDTIKKEKTSKSDIFVCAAILTHEAPYFSSANFANHWFLVLFNMPKSNLPENFDPFQHIRHKMSLIFLPLLKNICIFVKAWQEEPKVWERMQPHARR